MSISQSRPLSATTTPAAASAQPAKVNLEAALQPMTSDELASAARIGGPLLNDIGPSPLQNAVLDEMFGTGTPAERSQAAYRAVVTAARELTLPRQISDRQFGRDGIDYTVTMLDRLPTAQRRESMTHLLTAVDAARVADAGFQISPAALARLQRPLPFQGAQAQLA